MKKLYLVSEVLKVINNLIFIPMKTFTYFCRGLVALVAAAAFLASCSEDNLGTDNPDGPDTPGGQSPELTISEKESDLLIDYKGGDGIIVYYVSNPAEDGHVTAAVDADAASWVTEVTVDETNGLVAFNVAANLGQTSRKAEVTVTYAWGDKEQPKTVTVFQNGAPAGDPFTFSVTDITHNSAKVTVTPADTEMDYLVMYLAKEDFEKGYASDEQMYQEAMLEYAYAAEGLGYDSMLDYFEQEDVLYKGVGTIEYTEILAPETTYVVFAIGTTLGATVADMTMLTSMAYEEFTTAEAPQQELSFDFTYNSSPAGSFPPVTITVTPSDDEVWFYCEAQPASILSGGDVESYVKQYWEEWSLAPYLSRGYTVQQVLEMCCNQGVYECETYGTGEYFIFVFAPDPETGYVADLKYELFTINDDNSVTIHE